MNHSKIIRYSSDTGETISGDAASFTKTSLAVQLAFLGAITGGVIFNKTLGGKYLLQGVLTLAAAGAALGWWYATSKNYKTI